MSSTIIRSSVARRSFNPAVIWAMLGAIILAFESYVLAQWIGSGNFRPVPFDATTVPPFTGWVIYVTQIICPIIAGAIVVRFLVLPWWREGTLSTDGMLVIAYQSLWFQDPLGNLIHTQLYYSSAWLNMGSWTEGSFPGWASYNGNHLPEPILVMGMGYLWVGFATALAGCAAMKWTRNASQG